MHVAVAIIENVHKQILLALRQPHQHQGNLWEFPGGKVEKGETVYDTLAREMREELGVVIISAQPFITTSYHYSNKLVLLDAWRVTKFSGQPYGREGQTLKWSELDKLTDNRFPVANDPIIHALSKERRR